MDETKEMTWGQAFSIVMVILIAIWLLGNAITDNSTPVPKMTIEEQVQARAVEAQREDTEYRKAFSELEAACGKGNVWEGSGYGASRVFGCQDYKKVDIHQ